MNNCDKANNIERYKILSEEVHRCINLYFKAMLVYLAIVGVSIKLYFDFKDAHLRSIFWVLVQFFNLIALYGIYSFKCLVMNVEKNRKEIGNLVDMKLSGVSSFIFNGAAVTWFLGIIGWLFVLIYF